MFLTGSQAMTWTMKTWRTLFLNWKISFTKLRKYFLSWKTRRMKMMNSPDSIPEVRAFMEGIRGKEKDLSVILVGSFARQTQTENSDIDLLVISKETPVDLKSPRRVHLMRVTYDDFLKQLERG